ncbi:MAG: iron chelate uptake ABC transporter family permease subunit, partial [Alphaproteobacteria bacterium]|nr:iron chelate uptake ABC transporter family permease subunit [Alphaproteobacteria bacterium]
AGINYMLLGSTAAMTRTEAIVIGLAAATLIAITVLMLKEFALVAFDIEYGQAIGWPVARLDLAITLLLLAAVAIGLKTVGMILIIALVIIPPAAARFWTERLGRVVLLSGLFGALSGYVGTAISALVPDAPAGAVIVLTAGGLFMISLLCAPSRGVLASAARHFALRLNMAERAGLLHLDRDETPIGLERWALLRRGFLDAAGRPTAAGRAAAQAVAKDHGLWAQFIDEAPESALVSIADLARPIARALPPDALAALERRARAAGRI